MHRRGLQSVSSTASGSRVFLRNAHANAVGSKKPAKQQQPPPAHPKKKNKPPPPPLPKDRKFLGSLDGGRRSTTKIRDAPEHVHKDVRDVIKAYARGTRKPGQIEETATLEKSVQSTVPSLTKTQFFSEEGPDLEPALEPEGLETTQSLLPGTFVEIRRYVCIVFRVIQS